MKLTDTISKKPLRFFYVLAAVIFLANDDFAMRTVTINTPAAGVIFGIGSIITVIAATAGFSGSTSKIDFILTPPAGPADFTGIPYTATSNTSTLTVNTITGLNRIWNGFLSARYE